MGSHGIRDRVAIVGMGCTSFGENWSQSVDDLLVDSTTAALALARLSFDDIDAFWLGTMGSGRLGPDPVATHATGLQTGDPG